MNYKLWTEYFWNYPKILESEQKQKDTVEEPTPGRKNEVIFSFFRKVFLCWYQAEISHTGWFLKTLYFGNIFLFNDFLF